MTYQYQWVPMLQNAQGWYAKGIFGPNELPGKADDWLNAAKDQIPGVLQQGQELGFNFVSGQRPQPNNQGRIATTLEWAKKLTADDVKVLKGDAPYSETLPDPDAGFTPRRPAGPEEGRGGLQGPSSSGWTSTARPAPAATWSVRPRRRT